MTISLVGGEGTRLRPLTSTGPKPVVPLVDRPVISYVLEWLRAHGVDDVVMSCGFLAAGVRNVLGDGSRLTLFLNTLHGSESDHDVAATLDGIRMLVEAQV